MRQSLQELCESFIENRDIIKSTFAWDSAYMYPICAAIFTDKRQTADKDRLRQCRALLKDETGVFSNFRGTAKAATISMLAVSRDPEEKLKNALTVYTALKERFFTSQYLPVASMVIADIAQPPQFEHIAQRTRRIYDMMKSEHPFLTSSEDSVFAVLLAMSGLSDEQIVAETESCYQLLKPEFFSGNAVQSLSHVLALGEGGAKYKCDRTLDLFKSLKERGCKYATGYELATLGVLALLPAADVQAVADDVCQVDEYLDGQKGYGVFGVGRRQRLMHAGMLVSSDMVDDKSGAVLSSAAIGATVSLIVAQQAAMCAAIAASGAASASASSGGS